MKTFGIVASGPSATPEDAVRLREICDEVIAVNDSWRLCRNADHLYATDYRWWQWAFQDVMRDFEGELHTQRIQWHERPEDWGIRCWESAANPGLCTETGKIHTGQNSGYAAINVAYHLGAKRILLLGYDMSPDGGKRHWFDDRPENLNVASNYDSFAQQFSTIKPETYGLEILNVTRRTALKCFPRANLDALYAELQEPEDMAVGAVCAA